MTNAANTLNADMATLAEKYQALLPYLQQIDAVEQSVDKLAVAAKEPAACRALQKRASSSWIAGLH